MALEQITQAVLDAARNEADRIRKAAEMAATEKVNAGRLDAKTESERQYQAAVRSIDEEYHRKLSQTVGAANKEVLAERNRCMRRVFDTARQQILALPEDVYRGVMRRLLERAAEGHSGRLRVHPGEVPRFKALLNALNAAHAGAAQVTLDETAPLAEPGGFIFVSETYQVDQTLQTLLLDLEYELAPQVATAILELPGGDGAGS